MANSWSPLWSGIVDSSLWSEPDHVRIVFVTMLALKDSDDVYYGDAYKLSQRAKKPEGEVLDALRILASPDTRRSEPQEHGGRRIRAVDGGFLLLNGPKYREMMRIEMKRAKNRRNQATYRNKHGTAKSNTPLSGESSFSIAQEAGASESLLNAMNSPDYMKESTELEKS